MKVRDFYLKDFATAHKDAELYQLIEISIKKGTNGIFIIDNEGRLEGLVSIFNILEAIIPKSLKENPDLSAVASGCLFAHLIENKKHLTAQDIMCTKVPRVKLDTKIIEIAANSLQDENYRLAVVDDEGKVIGVINRTILREIIAKQLNISKET
jgi:predicted transcriptional regulator